MLEARGSLGADELGTLVALIERRSRQPGSSLYLLASPTGESVVGNVTNLPAGLLDARGMRQIEADRAAVKMPERGDGLQIEGLAGAVLHAGPQNKGHAMAVPLQHILKRIGSDQTGVRIRCDFNQAFGRIETVETDL